MRAFAYTAYDADGRRKAGTVVADSEAQASARLRAQGLFVSDIGARAEPRAGSGGGWATRSRLTADLRAVFTRQMAVLLAAEMPTADALDAVRQGGHPALGAVAARARAALMEGAALSEALEQADGGWPAYYTAAIRAGEASGDTAVVMGALADHLEALGQDRAQIGAALVYPAFVAVVSMFVCAILVTTVAPEIVAMFELSNRPLPDLTRRLLAVTDWIAAHWIWIAGAVGALVVLWMAASRIPAWRQARAAALLRLPLVGRLMRQGAAVQYLRTLALVLESRQTVPIATTSAARVLEIDRFAAEGAAVTEALGEGETLSRALERLSIVPPVARQLIQAGEVSARLARMTGRAAELVEHTLSTERKRIAALLEPLLMLLVGSFVLIVVLAVLLPIFDLQAVVAG